MSALGVEGLSVELGGKVVLEGIDAAVGHGDWVALIGPNGAGKSTLLRAVAGLVPFQGSVTLDGLDASRMRRRELARQIAFVPQAPLLPPGMRVSEYVLLGRTPHIGTFGAEGPHDLDATQQALERLDLAALADRRLHTLSGGEQQRAVLARALAQDAPFLLLDEPTASLDVGRQQLVLELVAGLREHGELTVLCAMHDLTLAGQYADRLLLLSQGRRVAEGFPAEIATEALIAEHYGADVRVIEHDGAIAIVPVRLVMTALAVELDGVLGDTKPLWDAWLEDVSRRAHVDPENLDEELPNWRTLLERFAEDHAPVYLRTNAQAASALRKLQADGVRVGVFTDAPEELAQIAVAHLGAARRIEVLEAGPGALDRLLAKLGLDARVVYTLADLDS